MTDGSHYFWYYTGQIRSKAHIAVIEPYQNRALCDVGVVSDHAELRPRTSNWCPKCVRAAQKLGLDPARIGLFNPDSSEPSGSPETDYNA